MWIFREQPRETVKQMQESWARTCFTCSENCSSCGLEGKEGIISENGRRCGQRGSPVKDHIVLSLVGCDSNFAVGYEGDIWESTGCLNVHLIILQIKISRGGTQCTKYWNVKAKN